MNKTKLIPFDLERWEAGDFKRVMDSCGNEITQLTFFKDVSDERQLIGVRLCLIESWTIKGSWYTEPHAWDLKLQVEEKTLEGWVNVFKSGLGDFVYYTYQSAIENAGNDRIDTIKITYPNE